MKNQTGQSLVELVVAIGIFVVAVGSTAFLVIDSYISGRLSKEITQANLLVEEGIEAVRAIRDNSWDGLISGLHGLVISGNNWVFQGTEEDVSWQLREGKRTINIEDIAPDRKKITSQINWNFLESRPQQIQLITYLTNWQKISAFCQGICTSCSTLSRGLCMRQAGCSWDQQNRVCVGTCLLCENFLDKFSCQRQLGCSWTGP